MSFPDLIDVSLWDRAGWKGLVFGYSEGGPPLIALAFTNSAAGKQIFQGLRAITGPVDKDELIRIAIIEGDIPGEEPGYSVHIGPNLDKLVPQPDDKIVLTLSRIHRMNPDPGSPYLPTFKKEFEKHRRYDLMNAAIKAGQPVIDESQSIEKHAIIFKHVSDLGPNDIDRIVLDRGHTGTTH